jgi:hypothetical protein
VSRRSLVLSALLASTLSGRAPGAPVPPPNGAVVEVVFCIDTTRDMQSALALLRPRLLACCDRCLRGRPLARLRVGLVAYRDRGDEYVTRIFDLTDDRNAVQRALDRLRADGGGDAPEAVNQGLHEAIHLVSWSAEPPARRQVVLIGSGPPHPDDEEGAPYPASCAAAAERGIVIHAVLVGDDAECAACWQEIAQRTGGRFLRGEDLGWSVMQALRPGPPP